MFYHNRPRLSCMLPALCTWLSWLGGACDESQRAKYGIASCHDMSEGEITTLSLFLTFPFFFFFFSFSRPRQTKRASLTPWHPLHPSLLPAPIQCEIRRHNPNHLLSLPRVGQSTTLHSTLVGREAQETRAGVRGKDGLASLSIFCMQTDPVYAKEQAGDHVDLKSRLAVGGEHHPAVLPTHPCTAQMSWFPVFALERRASWAASSLRPFPQITFAPSLFSFCSSRRGRRPLVRFDGPNAA